MFGTLLPYNPFTEIGQPGALEPYRIFHDLSQEDMDLIVIMARQWARARPNYFEGWRIELMQLDQFRGALGAVKAAHKELKSAKEKAA